MTACERLVEVEDHRRDTLRPVNAKEFQLALIVVLIAGSVIIGGGAVALYFIFRAFGGKKAGSSSHLGLIIGLVTFVFICCVLLFALAYVAR